MRTASDDAATTEARDHLPVMLAEVIEALAPSAGKTYIDATFGAGGYTRAILEHAQCNVLALDRDPSAITSSEKLCQAFPARLRVAQARFATLSDVAGPQLSEPPAGIVFDIGVSSMQLDDAERGFSFQADGPLDMRMGHAAGSLSEGAGPSAAEVVNTAPEALLADIFFELAEERRSRAIAGAIVRRRGQQLFARTADLAQVIAGVPGTHRPDGKHPATRAFQALRIWVNDELGELVEGLLQAETMLAPEGKLVVVTFHSLEDRIVKRFFAERTGRTANASRHLPAIVAKQDPSFRFVNSKPLSPSREEIARNPRSRSARLRWAVRTNAPPWKADPEALDLPVVLAHRR